MEDSAITKSYKHISLLCHPYKLYERMILNRVTPLLEHLLIIEQTGFRPVKSCTSQLLNLTQHIEDGYQRGMITGAAFVDLPAAYDTVNHRILIQKLYTITHDSQLCRFIQNMLSHRRFYVELTAVSLPTPVNATTNTGPSESHIRGIHGKTRRTLRGKYIIIFVLCVVFQYI